MQLSPLSSNASPAATTLPAWSAPAARADAGSTPRSSSANNSASQVSLSPQAVQKWQDDANHALDAGSDILQNLTRQTLSSLGITSQAEAMGARIEFDELHLKSKTTLSATFSSEGAPAAAPPPNRFERQRNGAQAAATLNPVSLHQEQASEISGSGRIILADGREFAFSSTLSVESSQDSQFAAPAAGDGGQTGGLRLKSDSPLLNMLRDMLNRLQQGQAPDTNDKADTASNNTRPAQGFAVGEPDPSRATDSNLFDFSPALNQLQQGAARLAQLLQPAQDSRPLATA